ncbi:hypothetical protein NA57DRAFT_63822 [Rhizodiscina lignyota]|uniref:Spindle pole body component n=1 Tax=Rhizodiscina lignyota TaxID=1504668 RepID=A0A9P4IPT5_9PEZI|nr:hypothetical protein NA57DRAFT_63822 [Rhizodiscina lignyota]
MLHEILLSLSGHPSPLFGDDGKTGAVTADDFPLVSPPEAALLSSVGSLSRRHRELRAHASRISSSHPSTICRAIASSIISTHLARFKSKVLDVEQSILKRDASTVAAYDIVPLSGIVGEFEGWKRRMDWYWGISCLIHPLSLVQSKQLCCGADIINTLRTESQTGYPDIEQAALELSKVAESAWLRQLSSWVLYGRLPTFGKDDFFIRQQSHQHGSDSEFVCDSNLMPNFVSPDTAASILFIGKSLNQIRSRGLVNNDHTPEGTVASEMELLPIHLKYLSELTFPLTSASLSAAISSIRMSLSRNTLQRLLPLSKIVEVLCVFQEFFLLGRGEFATSLVTEADERLSSRNQSGSGGDGLRGLILKDPELAIILNRSFATLSALVIEDDEDSDSDSTLELARSLIRFNVSKPSKSSIAAFHDILLPVPTSLTLLTPSPLDLFLSPADLSAYSDIHAYLLSIRRAHLHLTSVWRLTSMRRDHPAPAGPPISASKHGAEILRQRRARKNKREKDMRKVWATSSKAVFFLCELVSYLEGVVVKDAWAYLLSSITRKPQERPSSSSSMEAGRDFLNSSTRTTSRPEKSFPYSPRTGDLAPGAADPTAEENMPHDPTALASLHSAFLTSLTYALLLSNAPFTKELRHLLSNVEHFVAQIKRLQAAQSNLDLEEDEGVVDALNDWRTEEITVSREVDRARKKVDEGCRACVDVLGQVDNDGSRAGLLGEKVQGAGVDRLLMKLEFGSENGYEGDGDDSP